MPVILSIDTTTNACSCALFRDGNIAEHFDIIPRQHANRLLPMIEHLLEEQQVAYQDLNAVAFGQGPGSFTGLRIAAGVAQGIAFGAGVPVIPVSSLASLAAQVNPEAPLVFATLDARIDEVYWGFFRVNDNGVESVAEEGLCSPEDLPGSLPDGADSLIGVGSGLAFLDRMPAVYRECISDHLEDYYPRAGTIARLAGGYYAQGRLLAPEDVVPVYLRDKVTHNR